jgi:hypothetical protein
VRRKGVSILGFAQNRNTSPPFLRAKRAKNVTMRICYTPCEFYEFHQSGF